MADKNKRPLGLYLHFPFCVRKCRYCDFLSFPSDEAGREIYLERLKEEIKARGAAYQDYNIETLFIGGGTAIDRIAGYCQGILPCFACR